MFTKSNLLRRFPSDDSGNVAMIFAICLLVLCGVIGLAIDGARVVYASKVTSTALDAAALAAAKAISETELSDDEVRDVAQTYFDTNIQNTGGLDVEFGSLQVTIDRDVPSVDLTINGEVNTTFARIAHFDSFSFSKNSSVIYDRKDIELGVMIDITGSMSGSRIADLKEAARDLVDLLIPEDLDLPDQKTRIGLAPYSASVNAGAYAAQVTDSESQDGCVFERSGGEAYTDAAPSGTALLNAEGNPGNPQNNKYSCPGSEVLPITDQRDDLLAHIDSLSTGGWTAGHLGTAWAYYLVSPEWSNIWPVSSEPVSYNDPDTIKAVILMTDGDFNTSYLNGSLNTTSSEQAIELCNSMKDSNIVIYSVAFQAPASAEQTLRECASHDGGYFDADDGESLRSAFRDIAIRLLNLRLAD